MRRTVVLNVVGLSPRLLGEHTPHLSAFVRRGALRPLRTVLPAVTSVVQASMLTGLPPREHGIVGNGWYFRELCEVWFWRQSNHLMAGDKVWDTAKRRDASFRSAQLFWWFNMYGSADFTVTPRPMYPADGRKIPDIYTHPADLRRELNDKLGAFPLFKFWGPAADVESSRWITDCALHVMGTRRPTLTLVYLPHLDYSLQRLGPNDPRIAHDLTQIDALCGELIAAAEGEGARVIVLSEYGIVPVRAPVHINRALREAGLLVVREELGRELLDAGASAAFAVADHQIAHVYVRHADKVGAVRDLLRQLDGVAEVLDAAGKARHGLDHARSGELVALADADRWFSYYYWLDDARAPDFARTVDIHRKPGYDPMELFIDPALALPKLRVAWKLLCRTLGFRALLEVISLDATRVRGSHGVLTAEADGPLIASSAPDLLPPAVGAAEVKDIILRHVFS